MKFKSIFNTGFFLFLLIPLHGQTKEDINSEELYLRIQTYYKRKTPSSFSATITSSVISSQIGRIPKENIEFKKKPSAILSFKKGLGFKIRIFNVDDYYRDILSVYESILEKSGLYMTLGRFDSYPKFVNQFNISLLESKNNLYVLEVYNKNELPEDFGLFYFDQNWNLIKSTYYQANKVIAEATFTYSDYGNYSLVSEIKLQLINQNPSNLVFKFSDFKF